MLASELAFCIFDEAGQLNGTHLSAQCRRSEIQSGIGHTIAVLSEHVVCFVVKLGNDSAATDKNFAPWAPREGDAGTLGDPNGAGGQVGAREC